MRITTQSDSDKRLQRKTFDKAISMLREARTMWCRHAERTSREDLDALDYIAQQCLSVVEYIKRYSPDALASPAICGERYAGLIWLREDYKAIVAYCQRKARAEL